MNPDSTATRFLFTHAPQSVWLIFYVMFWLGLLYGLYWFYQRFRPDLSPKARWTLITLRGLTCLLLALIFMGPTLALTLQQKIYPEIVLLLDDSLSMSIEDAYPDEADAERVASALDMGVESFREKAMSRRDILQTLLSQKEQQFLKALSEKGTVRILSFSENVAFQSEWPAAGQAEADTTPDPETSPTTLLGDFLKAEGQGTDHAGAFRDALLRLQERPLAAMLLFGDGQNTSGLDPLREVSALQGPEIPLFTVGLGNPGDPVNARVVQVRAPEVVYRSDPFEVEVDISLQGLNASQVEVELLRRKVGEESDRSVERKRVERSETEELSSVTFSVMPEELGEFVYTVQIPEQPGELILVDNEKSTLVNVLDEKVRVLLLSSSPNWEYRMLRALLIRDKTFQVSCWLQSLSSKMTQDGDKPIKRLPTSKKEWSEYDVVMLIDPDPKDFSPPRLEGIEAFLGEHGGGLIWISGMQYSHRMLNQTASRDSVRRMLPVSFEPELSPPLQSSYRQEWPVRLAPEGQTHPALRLHRNAETNERLWAQLPGVYWHMDTQAAKPGFNVLMTHADPRFIQDGEPAPLMVSGQFGPGRTLYLGFQGTWRWRKLGVEVYESFWVKSIRHVMEGRLNANARRGQLNTDRDVYALKQEMLLTGKFFTESYEMLEQDELTVQHMVNGVDMPSVQIKAIPGRPGEYEGSLLAHRLGTHQFRVSLEGRNPVEITRSVTVEVPNVEFSKPSLNVAALEDMSANSGGGAYFEVDQLEELVQAIPERAEILAIPQRPRPLWDNLWVLLLLVSLLGAEWAVRKHVGMM